MEEKRAYNLQISTHSYRGVPITVAGDDTYHRIRLHEGGEDQIYQIFRNSDHYLVGFQRGVQGFHLEDCEIPNPPGAQVFLLRTKATHGALSRGGT